VDCDSDGDGSGIYVSRLDSIKEEGDAPDNLYFKAKFESSQRINGCNFCVAVESPVFRSLDFRHMTH
jgi:hypothetical protein